MDASNSVEAPFRLDRSDGAGRLQLGQRAVDLHPVSYTHLDVYKRQAQQRERAVAGVTRALAQGEAVARIGPTFPISETAAAHEAVERGTIGNVIVRIA